MKLNLLSDTDWESRIDKVLDELSATGYRRLFESHNYGAGLAGIIVVFMCRDSSLHFKRRIRFVKREKMLYIDIMLNLDQMRQIEHLERKKIVARQLADELPTILRKYSIPNFEKVRFIEDLRNWLKDIV